MKNGNKAAWTPRANQRTLPAPSVGNELIRPAVDANLYKTEPVPPSRMPRGNSGGTALRPWNPFEGWKPG